MGRFTKRVILGLTAALTLAAGGAFAQEVSPLDDFEGGTNMNLFGDYWYFFDDNNEKSSLSGVAANQATGWGSSSVSSARAQGSGASKQLLFVPALSIAAGEGVNSTAAAVLDFTLGNSFLMGYDNTSPNASREVSFEGSTIAHGNLGVVTGVSAADIERCGAGWKCGPFQFAPFVGIGTNLVMDGKKDAPKGFENATALRFWAKAENPLSVWVFFEQSDVGWYTYNGEEKQKAGGFFGRWVNIGTNGAYYEVDLTDVHQNYAGVATNNTDHCNGHPGKDGVWTCDTTNIVSLRQPMWVNANEQDLVATFDRSKIVKVAWQVQAANGGTKNMGNTNNPHVDTDMAEFPGYSNKLYLDDISFTGFRFVADDMCESCIMAANAALPAGAARFDQFTAAAQQNQNCLGYYWYVYDDTKAVTDDGVNGNSQIGQQGTEKDCESPYVDQTKGECEVLIQPAGTDSDAPYLSARFLLGESITIEEQDVSPFVGIGTNLFQDKDVEPADYAFYDADAAGVKGLYFEYRTVDGSDPIRKITFEVSDKWDATGARPAAAVYYIDLPTTGGAWNKANVAFSKLVQHLGWENVKDFNNNPANASKVALATNALAKFQFKVQDGKGKNGYLQIRNVYTLDQSGVSTKFAAKGAGKYVAPRASYSRGVIGVSGSVAQNIASGKLSLVNVKGRTVASAQLVKSGLRVTANLGKGTIPTGMYFVRINAKDVQGKKVVQQVPLTIVK